jgi:hypothetical protein
MPVLKRKYARKPLLVDAVQVTAENFAEIAAWCQGTITSSDGSQVSTIDPSTQYIHVRVHNPVNTRQSKAFCGDWILYTDRGYKIYTNKAFKGAFTPYDPEPLHEVTPHIAEA